MMRANNGGVKFVTTEIIVMDNRDGTMDDAKVHAAVVLLRKSDKPRNIVLVALFDMFVQSNLNKLRETMNQLGTDVQSLAAQVATNTATEQQLITDLQSAIANADDPSTDTTVQSLITQLQSNNSAMQSVLATVPGAAGASSGSGASGSGASGSGASGSGDSGSGDGSTTSGATTTGVDTVN